MYCREGKDSDVTAFFHMMGHLVCETCDEQFASKGGLKSHLQAHRKRGDRVPEAGIAKLQGEMEASWEQAMREGRSSIPQPKPLGVIARALMVIINP